MSSRRIGSQEPTRKREPARCSTDGPDAAELSAAYGLEPDPWQRTVLDCWLGRDGDDRYTARTCVLDVPRQNGKNGVLEMRELYGLTVLGERILHSAHEVKTAAEAFRRLCGFFENPEQYPEMAEMLLRVRRTNGQEAIELTNGAVIRFSARSRGAARGMTFDVIVMDEAQELTDEHIEAMVPTKSSSPLGNPQTIYTGTSPKPGYGLVFARIRKSALEGSDDATAIHEWGVDELGDVCDMERAWATNPAMGVRITEQNVADELAVMSPEGFARERLGWWDELSTGAALISEAAWERLGDEDIAPSVEEVGAGIKFSADGGLVAIAIAARQPDGKAYVELKEYRTLEGGMGWASDWVVERLAKVKAFAIDGRSNAAAFRTILAARGVPKLAVPNFGANDAAAAASMLIDSISAEMLVHNGDGTTAECMTGVTKRKIGTGGGFGFAGVTEERDPTPADAIAQALWALNTSKRDPRRKARQIW